MKLPVYLSLLHKAEETLRDSFGEVADGHGDEPDVHAICLTLAAQCDEHQRALSGAVARYGESPVDDEPARLHADGLAQTRSGAVGLLRDLQDLHTLATFVHVTWTVVDQAAKALRDKDLQAVVDRCDGQTTTQIRWLQTRIKEAAPQALIVAT